MKFKIGDRVCCTTEYHMSLIQNKTGTVRRVIDNVRVGVEFDEDIKGHDLGGTLSEMGRGWFISEEYLKFSKITNWKEIIQ